MSHNLGNNFMIVNLVRHAQSFNNAIETRLRKEIFTLDEFWKRYEELRVSDPELSEKGVEQARTLADHLETTMPSRPLRLFCSPLHRSIQTAQILSVPLGVTPELWVDVFEEGGLYHESDSTVRPGKTVAEIEALGVKVPSDFAEGFVARASPEGWWNHAKETSEESYGRAQGVVRKLVELASLYATQKMNIWVVTHGDFMSDLIKTLLNINPVKVSHKDLYFYHDNCGVTQLSINSNGDTKVNFINRHIIPFATAAMADSPQHTVVAGTHVNTWSWGTGAPPPPSTQADTTSSTPQ